MSIHNYGIDVLITCICCNKRLTSLVMLNKHLHLERGAENPKYFIDTELWTGEISNIKVKLKGKSNEIFELYESCPQKEIGKLLDDEIQTVSPNANNIKRKEGDLLSPEGLIPCDVCGYLFHRDYLRRHKQSHAKVKEFNCKICQKVFQTESSLNCHKLHHQKEVVNQCHVCGKMFKNGPNLRQHIKSHTREKTLKCPVCDKKFASNYVLKDHISRHSDMKPHTCTVCNRSFRKSQEVKRHMLVHSDNRNHKCSHCSRTFKSRSNRIKHEKIHSKPEHHSDLSGSSAPIPNWDE